MRIIISFVYVMLEIPWIGIVRAANVVGISEGTYSSDDVGSIQDRLKCPDEVTSCFKI